MLREGDLVSIDCGAQVSLWNGDAAVSVVVGGRDAASPEDLAVRSTTPRPALLGRHRGPARAGESLYAVGAAVEDSLTDAGQRRGREYGIVEDYVGHGVGTSMHMDPQVPNYRVSGKGPKVVDGTTIPIEPMWSSATRTTSCSTTSGRSSPATAPAPPLGALGRRDDGRPHGAHRDRRRRGPAARPRRPVRPARPCLTDPRPPTRPGPPPRRRGLRRCARSLADPPPRRD